MSVLEGRWRTRCSAREARRDDGDSDYDIFLPGPAGGSVRLSLCLLLMNFDSNVSVSMFFKRGGGLGAFPVIFSEERTSINARRGGKTFRTPL